jgi:hypothetical protein
MFTHIGERTCQGLRLEFSEAQRAGNLKYNRSRSIAGTDLIRQIMQGKLQASYRQNGSESSDTVSPGGGKFET